MPPCKLGHHKLFGSFVCTIAGVITFRKKRQLIIFDEDAKCLLGKLFSAEYEWSSIAAAARRDSSSEVCVA